MDPNADEPGGSCFHFVEPTTVEAVDGAVAEVEPLVEDPTVDDPTVEDPTVDDPTVEDPTVEDPTVTGPVAPPDAGSFPPLELPELVPPSPAAAVDPWLAGLAPALGSPNTEVVRTTRLPLATVRALGRMVVGVLAVAVRALVVVGPDLAVAGPDLVVFALVVVGPRLAVLVIGEAALAGPSMAATLKVTSAASERQDRHFKAGLLCAGSGPGARTRTLPDDQSGAKQPASRVGAA